MKTSTMTVHVEPEYREPSEQVQADFIARGLRSLAKARETGEYVKAGDAIRGLKKKLARADAHRLSSTR